MKYRVTVAVTANAPLPKSSSSAQHPVRQGLWQHVAVRGLGSAPDEAGAMQSHSPQAAGWGGTCVQGTSVIPRGVALTRVWPVGNISEWAMFNYVPFCSDKVVVSWLTPRTVGEGLVILNTRVTQDRLMKTAFKVQIPSGSF